MSGLGAAAAKLASTARRATMSREYILAYMLDKRDHKICLVYCWDIGDIW
jgi:hypothetical protein